MNLDIVSVTDELDLGLAVTAVAKAGNVLATQLGDLDYAPDFGVDKRYFLESPFRFQNNSFRAYLVERLTLFQINVTDVIETFETLYSQFTFMVDNPNESRTGFIG